MIVAHPSVNVDDAVVLGKKQLESFEHSLPDGFHEPIPKIVKPMPVSRKHIKIGNSKVFDMEAIYARAMGVLSRSRSLDTDHLLAHELAPYPTSLFDENGKMRGAKIKSNLKNALKVELPDQNTATVAEAVFWMAVLYFG